MSQSHVQQIQMTPVLCNLIQHQGETIRSLCLNPECKASSAVCYKCLNSVHPNCRNSINEIEDIPNQLMGLRTMQLNILNLQKSVNQQFKDLLAAIEQLLKPLATYQESPNLTNLNGLGSMLKSLPKNEILKTLDQRKKIIRSLLDDEQQVKETKLSQNVQQDDQDWYKKGMSLYQQKKYDEAIKCYNQAIEIDPKNGDYFIWKGMSLYQQKKYDEAIKCYNQAIEIDPKKSYSFYWKGVQLYQQKKYNEAIKCFNQAIEIDPKIGIYFQWKGDSLFNLKRFEEAITCYEQSLSLQPDDQYTKDLLAEAKEALTRTECTLM